MIHTLTLTSDARIKPLYFKSRKCRPIDVALIGAAIFLGPFDFILAPFFLATKPDPMDIKHKPEIEAELDKILLEQKIQIKYDNGKKLYINNNEALELQSYEFKMDKIIVKFRFFYSIKDFPNSKIFRQEECRG